MRTPAAVIIHLSCSRSVEEARRNRTISDPSDAAITIRELVNPMAVITRIAERRSPDAASGLSTVGNPSSGPGSSQLPIDAKTIEGMATQATGRQRGETRRPSGKSKQNREGTTKRPGKKSQACSQANTSSAGRVPECSTRE
jgi:hypothetical protein